MDELKLIDAVLLQISQDRFFFYQKIGFFFYQKIDFFPVALLSSTMQRRSQKEVQISSYMC